MTLDEWMALKGMTNRDLAEKIGLSEEAVRLYRRGARQPRPEAMGAIYRETGGAVAPNDFFALAGAPLVASDPEAA